MSQAPEHEYVLGTDEEEYRRLGFQHRVWSEHAFALWERANFRPGLTILDVGCGPGYAALDLAQLVGRTGRVIAVDVSARFIDQLRVQLTARGLSQIDARVCDVQKLDLPPASVEGAYTRWVLCFVPDPEAVVAGVARALRPGGTFAIQDYYHYRGVHLAPYSAAFDRVFDATDKSWRMHGGDPNIAGRLPAMLRRNGLRVTDVRSLVRSARPDSLLWQWPTTFFRVYVPRLVDMGLLTPAEAQEFHAEWNRRSSDPDAVFCTPPMLEIIGVKA